MTQKFINGSIPMGEIGVARGEGLLRTLLGSCLGVALYDRKQHIAGLVHIVLPESNGKTELPGKYADTAIPETIRRMEALTNGEPLKLTAKLAGGANMFGTATTNTVGEQNLSTVERLLNERRITVIGRHVGGEKGRRMAFDVESGQVSIEVVGAETETL